MQLKQSLPGQQFSQSNFEVFLAWLVFNLFSTICVKMCVCLFIAVSITDVGLNMFFMSYSRMQLAKQAGWETAHPTPSQTAETDHTAGIISL